MRRPAFPGSSSAGSRDRRPRRSSRRACRTVACCSRARASRCGEARMTERRAGGVTPGRVTLVGGGPGARDLLTLGAVEALRQADVVRYDRLAPIEVLDEFCPDAVHIDVGKLPGHHAVPQHEIERLLVEHALAGARVVRL